MTVPGSQGSSASADVLAQVQAQLEAARIAAKSARSQTRWTAVGGVLVALIAAFATYLAAKPSDAGTSPPPAARLTIGWNNQQDGSDVGQFINASGPVSGLKRGELVWTFNQPLFPKGGNHLYYPNTGPCAVAAGTWTCNDIDIGGAGDEITKKGLGKYRVWVVVVSEQDAFGIVTHIRCFPSGTPATPGVGIKASCLDSYQSLPGSDIVGPQEITVTRTR